MPSTGLVIANQNETFQPGSCAVEFAFTLFSQASENRHFRKPGEIVRPLVIQMPISLDVGSQGESYWASDQSRSTEEIMAKKDNDSVYKVVEVVGTSTKSWADAGRKAVETAAGSLRDLRIAEVMKLDMAIENGKVRAYRARVALSFKIEG